MKEKGKKIITLSIILFMVLNYLLPLVNYAEFNLCTVKDVIVKGLDENHEEIGREYEIKETEEWDISENGDGSVIAKWKLENKSLTITGTGKMKDLDWNSTTDWKRIYKRLIEKVIVEDGITTIGKYSFRGCDSLKIITIPESVTDIGDNVFEGCSSLINITIPNGVTKIGSYAFYKCESLKKITIPESVTSIRYGAFEGCSGLTSITIPEGVKNIESSAFYGCSSLEEINVSEKNAYYTSIEGVLYNKQKTTLIKYPENKIGEHFSIPQYVTNIESRAFYGCSSLANITLPNDLTRIGYETFKSCSRVTITIPENITVIGKDAFYGVKNIICKTNSYAHKYAEENKVSYILSDNVISNYTTEYQIKDSEEWDISANGDRSIIAKWKLEDRSLTISGTGEMKNWDDESDVNWHKKYKNMIEKIIIETGVINVGSCAFSYCSSLTSVNIPNSVTSIEGYAFCECSNLTSIVIHNSVKNIGEGAFYGCSSLTNILIPESVEDIGDDAFFGCSSLTEINVSEKNLYYTSIDGVLFNKERTELIKYPENKQEGKYTIPGNLSEIEWYPFYNSSNLKEIDIPNGVEYIGEGAFYGCKNLTSIKIPNSVTSIADSAFSGCSSLKDIMIPDSVIKIEDGALKNVKNIVCKKNSYVHKYAEENKIPYYLSDLSDMINNDENNKIGDVNENSKIDIGDILLIKRHMAYTNSTIVANKHTDWKLSDEKTKIGDINKNGKIDIGDILKLQRYISASNSKEVAEKHKEWLNL